MPTGDLFVVLTQEIASTITDVQIGPLYFPTIFDALKDQMGDGTETVGRVVLPGAPTSRPFALTIPVRSVTRHDANDWGLGMRLRRQTRALLDNAQARREPLWFSFAADPDVNGWLFVGTGELEYDERGVSFAEFKLSLSDCFRVGSPITHREARQLLVTDRRLSTTPRDYKERIFGTWFASMVPAPAHYLPAGASTLESAPYGRTVTSPGTVSSRDGAIPQLTGRVDLDVVAFESTPGPTRGDVAIFDRRGSVATADWEQICGPLQASSSGDIPIVDNGVCRVRYQAGAVPSFSLDRWDTTTSAWIERGRIVTVIGSPYTLIDSRVARWTPERAVVVARFALAGGVIHEVFLSLQRGWTGPRVEVYAIDTAGIAQIVRVGWVTADTGSQTATKHEAGTDVTATGAPPTFGLLGASGFTGENWLQLRRTASGGPDAGALAVQSSVSEAWAGSDQDLWATSFYGAPHAMIVVQTYTSYVGVHIGLYPDDGSTAPALLHGQRALSDCHQAFQLIPR